VEPMEQAPVADAPALADGIGGGDAEAASGGKGVRGGRRGAQW